MYHLVHLAFKLITDAQRNSQPGSKAFRDLFFFAAFIGSTITTSVTACACVLVAGAGGSDLPNSARRISSSINSVFITALRKGAVYNLTHCNRRHCSAWIFFEGDRSSREDYFNVQLIGQYELVDRLRALGAEPVANILSASLPVLFFVHSVLDFLWV